MDVVDLQSVGTNSQTLSCTVKVMGHQDLHFPKTIDCAAQIRDIRDVILASDDVIAKFGNVSAQYNWTVFFVDGDIRVALGDTLVLNTYSEFGDLIATAGLELKNVGVPAEPGAAAENVWAFPVVVHDDDDNTLVPRFTMDINVTVPASSVIESIMLHDNQALSSVRNMLVNWNLILVHEDIDEEDILSEDVCLRSVADDVALSAHVHLKVKING